MKLSCELDLKSVIIFLMIDDVGLSVLASDLHFSKMAHTSSLHPHNFSMKGA